MPEARPSITRQLGRIVQQEDARLASGKSGGRTRSIHHLALSSTGWDACLSRRQSGFDSRQGYHSALWRSSKRSGLIRRGSKVQVLPALPFARSVLQAAHSDRTGGAPGQMRQQTPWAGRLTGRHGRRNAVIRVRFPAGPPVASSSNGKDTCPSNRERGFNSRRGYQCRSSSNGQSAALRTRRLGDRTLRAAPAYRDRLAIGQLPLKQ